MLHYQRILSDNLFLTTFNEKLMCTTFLHRADALAKKNGVDEYAKTSMQRMMMLSPFYKQQIRGGSRHCSRKVHFRI